MAFGNGYTIGFAAVICVVCAIGVSSASISLRPLQDANRKRALQAKVLSALDIKDADGTAFYGEAIDSTYLERVDLRIVDGEGMEQPDKTYEDVQEARQSVKGTDKLAGLYAVYLRKDGEKIGAYAMELQGKGLWGPLSGYLALAPDGKTVIGATFDAPKETPGLGAEIMAAGFQDQWIGKMMADSSGALVPIDVVKGSAALACPGRIEHCVDGLSGATITGRGADKMIEDAIDQYGPYLKNVQSGGAR
jgi:Na+-transporting NADH:ubiquinone oxidoreductase subunit C